MILLTFHVVLVFFSTFMLVICIGQLIEFFSNQGVMGSYGIRHPPLRSKSLNEWTEEEEAYVLPRLFRDLMYLAIFMLQHSIMSSTCWKQLWNCVNINVSLRLFYVIATCLSVNMMVSHWESTPDVVLWEVNTSNSRLLWCFFFLLHTAAWLILLLQVMVMNPLELVGVIQVYNFHNGKREPLSYMHPQLQVFYRHMRHAGPSCLWLMLWVHPVMTADRFLAAIVFSLYMAVAHQLTSSDYKFAHTHFVVEDTAVCTYNTSSVKRKK